MWSYGRDRRFELGGWLALVAAVIGLSSVPAVAQDLLSRCQPPVAVADNQAEAQCDLYINDFAEIVKVTAVRDDSSRAELPTAYEPWQDYRKSSMTYMLVQDVGKKNKQLFAEMIGDVAVLAAGRPEGRQFHIFTFKNDVQLIAGSGVARDSLSRQLLQTEPSDGDVDVNKSIEKAIARIKDEEADRKAILVFGDGTTPGDKAEQEFLTKMASDAGIAVHIIAYRADNKQPSGFNHLVDLAIGTNGTAHVLQYKRKNNEVREKLISHRLWNEVLENGGTLKVTVPASEFKTRIKVKAELSDGRELTATAKVPPVPPTASDTSDTTDAASSDDAGDGEDKPAAQPEEDNASESEPAKTDDSEQDEGGGSGWLLSLLGLVVLGGAGYAAYVYYPHVIPLLMERAFAKPETPKGDAKPYAWIEVLDGGKRHELTGEMMRIGRNPTNDIHLSNSSVSRQHAVILRNPAGEVSIKNLSSVNEALVNGKKTTVATLSHGDVVQLGEVKLKFHAGK